jgi:hypothetical protein
MNENAGGHLFVGLVFWPLHALTGLTHKLSAFDPSDSTAIETIEMALSVGARPYNPSLQG